MLFSIAIGLMVVLIAGFWAYQGLFSSALMFFECVVACLAAFGFYEALNGLWSSALGNGIGRGLAFAVLFLAVVALLRVATDKLFRENVRLPMIVDRVGAGVFGLFSGLILVGCGLVTAQLLPIGGSVFGFNRVSERPDGTLVAGGLLLAPDAFVVGLANVASGGGLSGGNPMKTAKPDMLLDLYSARAAVQSEDRIDIPPDSVKVNAYWETKQIDFVKQKLDGTSLVREFETREPVRGKLLVCNVTVDVAGCLKDKNEMYLRVPQFRIVGPSPDGGRTPAMYLASGMSDLYVHRNHNWRELQDRQQTRLVHFGPETDFFIGPNQTRAIADPPSKDKEKIAAVRGWRFDVAFEVPDDFEPWYLAFKSGARAEINKAKMFKQTPPPYASTAQGNSGPGRTLAAVPEKPKVGAAPGGTSHIANAIEERTGAFDDLPLVLSSKEAVVSRALKGGKLSDCHFFVEVPTKEVPKAQQVTKFIVPEGKKMLQIGAEKNFAGSLYGQVLNWTSNALNQTVVTADNGTKYVAQGVYSVAPVNGKMTIEIQYIEDADTSDLRLKQPKKVTSNIMRDAPKDQRRLGFIFIVDPGVKIVEFSSGGLNKAQPMNIDIPG